MKKIFLLSTILFAGLITGCSILQTPDAPVTLSEQHVATPTGLTPSSQVEPGTYAQNQVIEAGTYSRAELEAFAPGPLPENAIVQPGQSPSFLENLLVSISGVAGTIPGGQPVGVLLLGAAGIAKVWRDKKKRVNAENVARTLGSTLDTALDVVATLPDRDQARKIEAQILSAREHFAKSYRAVRESLDAVLEETGTPRKEPING